MRLAEERRIHHDRERQESSEKRFMDFQREQTAMMRDMFAMVTGNGSNVSQSRTRGQTRSFDRDMEYMYRGRGTVRERVRSIDSGRSENGNRNENRTENRTENRSESRTENKNDCNRSENKNRNESRARNKQNLDTDYDDHLERARSSRDRNQNLRSQIPKQRSNIRDQTINNVLNSELPPPSWENSENINSKKTQTNRIWRMGA